MKMVKNQVMVQKIIKINRCSLSKAGRLIVNDMIAQLQVVIDLMVTLLLSKE
jgi:hypothetical protein